MQFSRNQLNNVFMQNYLISCLATSTDLQDKMDDLQPFCTAAEFADLKDFNSRVLEFNELVNRDAKNELNDDERAVVASYEKLIDEPTGLTNRYRKKMYDNLLFCIDKHYLSNSYYNNVLAKQIPLINEDFELNLAAKELIFHNKGVSDEFLALMQDIFSKMKHKDRFEYRDVLGLPTTKSLPAVSGKNTDNPKNWSKTERQRRLDVILRIHNKINNPQEKITLLHEGLAVAENNGNSRSYNFAAKRDFCLELRNEYAKAHEHDLADKYQQEAEKWQRSVARTIDFAAEKGYMDKHYRF